MVNRALTLFCILFTLFALALSARAEVERDVDEAMKAATDGAEEMDAEQASLRPSNLPDLTKGETIPLPKKGGPITWNMGQTGVIGIKNAGFAGDQVQVVAVLPGSPAEGKVLPGDVVLGVQNKKFVAGGHLGLAVGNALIQAEEEAGKGLFKMNLWRDRNWLKRTGSKDMLGVDIEKIFKEAEAGAELYEWQGEEEKTASVKKMAFDEFPIDGVRTNITLQLQVMGTYSETSPWDCPVAEKIRENACKVLVKSLQPDKNGRVRGDWPTVLALVASGKPEYRELAKKWVHCQKTETNMNARFSLDDLKYRGMQSWHNGFESLEMAIYQEATKDDYILPEIRKRAILTAMGQSGGGSWGHTFAFPEFNGGILHGINPGYGGMNNAGTRCFFLLALAQKAGIQHEEIQAAIHRASRFFGTYVDKGCIPYGDHAPWPSDDSNGKNYGAAYAFYVLGKKYEGTFFSMHSANAAFSRRGGHGSPTLWYYTPLSANIAGPRGVQASMRNMRWFYTLSRRYDGSFVFQGEQAGIGGKGMRSPTATHVLFYSAPLKQLIITGKDADPNFWLSDEELDELYASARSQITDPVLLAKIGKPWNERKTDEVIALLDHFYPKMRGAIAQELAKRFEAGEKDMLPKVLKLLKSEEARMRDGACLTLSACGADVVLSNLSGVTALLKDSAEFVRMTAASTIGKATDPGDPMREKELLMAAADDYPGRTMDMGNVRTEVKGILFARKKGKDAPVTLLATEPFKAGFDEELVRTALENIVTMDPQGTVPGTWSQETLLKLAGPVTFAAEDRQLNDAMFGGARKSQGQALLRKYNYREAVEGDAGNLIKRRQLDRRMRMKVGFKDANITPTLVKKAPGLYRAFLDDLRQWQQDKPIFVLSESMGKGNPPLETPLNELIELIEKDTAPNAQPSIGPEVEKMFQSELARAGDEAAQLKRCRKELDDLERHNFFRKMYALTFLTKKLGVKAIDEIAPFLGDRQWRLREHANQLAVELVKKGAGPRLIECYKESAARKSGLLGNQNAAGILAALTEAQYQPTLAVAKAALQHTDPLVRKAAVQTVFTLGGDAEFDTVVTFMSQAKEMQDFWGCELALLSRRDDPAHAQRVRDRAISLLPKSTPEARSSLIWILGQLGNPDSLAALQKEAATTKDDDDLNDIITALSYSPDRAADQVMLTLAKQDKRLLEAVAAHSVRRMVGRHGLGDVTDAERLDFAAPLLNMKHEPQLITFLGKVHTGRSIQTLYEAMKRGSAEVAAPAIIAAADGMEKKPEAERALAAEALTGVIEYLEVTKLRGGVSAHMNKEDKYGLWKTIQARAGRVLLKIHKPKEAAIPTFDDRDLNL